MTRKTPGFSWITVTLPKVNVSVVEVVAASASVIVVPSTMVAIVSPLGMPPPLTGMPTLSRAVLETVTEVVALVTLLVRATEPIVARLVSAVWMLVASEAMPV